MDMHRTNAAGGRTRRAIVLAAVSGLVAGLGGCGAESDSWLFDPSVVGRWERTPTAVPILGRIASIEGPQDEWIVDSEVQPGDLMPEPSEYRIGPGDKLTVVLYDIPEEGRQFAYERFVDTRGYIDLPQLGSINVGGQTATGATEVIKAAMKDLVNQPLANVEITQQSQARFSVVGGVQNPGPYFIPRADYRLLDALAAAGGFSEASESIYIIRQAPLVDAASGKPKAAPSPESQKPVTPPTGEGLIEIINQLSNPAAQPKEPPPSPPPGEPKPGGSPGVFRSAQPAQAGTQPATPPIDLIDPSNPVAAKAVEPKPETPAAQATDTTWVYLNGKWMRVKSPTAAPGQPETLPGQPTGEMVMTQRIIRIPMSRLVAGDARVNPVVRPGDVIRVPPPPPGTIFIGGQVNRVGTYQMTEKLTLSNAIIAAGGLSGIAIPERVDLTRMVGRDRLATVRLNLKAIYERTQPDVYLKAYDQINVGTNFWATPWAVIRNGFRFTYGFGFLCDRNFGNDIFGPPPESNGFNF
jgi:polysaccharide export outer membrane protein